MRTGDLAIIQRTVDLIEWYVPFLERLPAGHRHVLGKRIQEGLYDLLEALILARYTPDDLERLQRINAHLDVLRCQTRLLVTFQLLDQRRHEHVAGLINAVGVQLGGWIQHRRRRIHETAREPVEHHHDLGQPVERSQRGTPGKAV